MKQENRLLAQQTLMAAPLHKGAGYIAAGTEKSIQAGERIIKNYLICFSFTFMNIT